MTIIDDFTTTPFPTTCPDWCHLAPGHGVDSIHDDGRQSRGHAGPSFGRFVAVGSREFLDQPGVHTFDVGPGPEVEHEVETAADAIDLARCLIEGAQWVMAREQEDRA
jgi:hypothetical protein